MKFEEIKALRELYVAIAVSRAIDEIGEPWLQSEDDRIAEKRLAEQLQADAYLQYQQQRGPGASDAEFEYVWLLVRDDLVREARALEAMRK